MGDNGLLLYCRAGFERECAQEIQAIRAASAQHAGARVEAESGFVEFATDYEFACEFVAGGGWRRLIFARQCLATFARLAGLPRSDRLTPLIECLSARGERFNEVWVEAPDSDSGKALAAFCKSFGSALAQALKRARLLDASAPRRLHAFFPQSGNAILAAAEPDASAPWPQGIPRLKFPNSAPSRSTLKLDEAFLVLLTAGERERWLKPGMHAVDLGAAPGGWTWQLVRRSMRVIAVDNGPMAPALLDSGLVAHRREDGFRFRPVKPVDWLVCDMVEQPRRVAELIARWLGEGWCRRAMFNLKLPMKQRYMQTRQCLDAIAQQLKTRGKLGELRAKQLYHDREEITVFAQVKTVVGSGL